MASSNSSSSSVNEQQVVSGEWTGNVITRSMPSSPTTARPPVMKRSGSAVEFSWLSYLVPGNRCRVTRNGVKLPVVVKSAALMQPWSMGKQSTGARKHSCHHHEQAIMDKKIDWMERRMA